MCVYIYIYVYIIHYSNSNTHNNTTNEHIYYYYYYYYYYYCDSSAEPKASAWVRVGPAAAKVPGVAVPPPPRGASCMLACLVILEIKCRGQGSVEANRKAT